MILLPIAALPFGGLPGAVLLGALSLPDHVTAPGARHVALSLGVENLHPSAELHLGLLDLLAVHLSGTWIPDAPLFGAEVRVAAGHSQRGLLHAHAFAEGHLRPVFDADVISGADVGAGVGIFITWGALVARLDGGASIGIEGPSAGVDDTFVDQRGGFFALQRALLGLDLFDRVEVALTSRLGIPVAPVRVESATDDRFADRWDVRWGARASVRF